MSASKNPNPANVDDLIDELIDELINELNELINAFRKSPLSGAPEPLVSSYSTYAETTGVDVKSKNIPPMSPVVYEYEPLAKQLAFGDVLRLIESFAANAPLMGPNPLKLNHTPQIVQRPHEQDEKPCVCLRCKNAAHILGTLGFKDDYTILDVAILSVARKRLANVHATLQDDVMNDYHNMTSGTVHEIKSGSDFSKNPEKFIPIQQDVASVVIGYTLACLTEAIERLYMIAGLKYLATLPEDEGGIDDITFKQFVDQIPDDFVRSVINAVLTNMTDLREFGSKITHADIIKLRQVKEAGVMAREQAQAEAAVAADLERPDRFEQD